MIAKTPSKLPAVPKKKVQRRNNIVRCHTFHAWHYAFVSRRILRLPRLSKQPPNLGWYRRPAWEDAREYDCVRRPK